MGEPVVMRIAHIHILQGCPTGTGAIHDDVIKWKHFPRNWPFVREIHRSPVNFPHKGQWRGALMFSLIYDWINDWVNNHEAGNLRRQHCHYDVIVMHMTLSPRWKYTPGNCSYHLFHMITSVPVNCYSTSEVIMRDIQMKINIQVSAVN